MFGRATIALGHGPHSSCIKIGKGASRHIAITLLWTQSPPPYNIVCSFEYCYNYIFALSFLYIYLFFSPNLSGRRLDVYHASAHGVALVRI